MYVSYRCTNQDPDPDFLCKHGFNNLDSIIKLISPPQRHGNNVVFFMYYHYYDGSTPFVSHDCRLNFYKLRFEKMNNQMYKGREDEQLYF